MSGTPEILPLWGRGTAGTAVEGAGSSARRLGKIPTTTPLRVAVPLPRRGRIFHD